MRLHANCDQNMPRGSRFMRSFTNCEWKNGRTDSHSDYSADPSVVQFRWRRFCIAPRTAERCKAAIVKVEHFNLPFVIIPYSNNIIGGSRGGTGVQTPSAKNHRNIGFSSNTGPDPLSNPLMNFKKTLSKLDPH